MWKIHHVWIIFQGNHGFTTSMFKKNSSAGRSLLQMIYPLKTPGTSWGCSWLPAVAMPIRVLTLK
jgi:hypothetical protein